MSTLVMIDGQSHNENDAKVSVFDRGFLYGDSVFETVRTYGGEPYALDEHLKRLEWSAGRVFIPLPCDVPTLKAEVMALLERAANPESMIRIMISRGVGELGLPPSSDARATRVVIVAPLVPPKPEAYTNGVSVITYRTQRLADATDAAGAKIGNYLVSVLAMREAKQHGAVEALVIDARDQVVEGTSSNLFVVKAGVLITPPETAGILPGITRARVLALADRLGLNTEFRTCDLAELLASDEVFISSSIREILPVVKVDERRIADGKPGPITTRLIAEFRAQSRQR